MKTKTYNMNSNQNPYLLLTPGPLSTSRGVKEAMMHDWCTWDDDYNVNIVQKIRKKLVALATESINEYTCVLMQGSGTFSVEAALGSIIPANGVLLILSNGAYGQRIAEIARMLKIKDIIYEESEDEIHNCDKFFNILESFPDITHVAMVHCETTTGLLNPFANIAGICKERGIVFILDAMSSFGGIPMDLLELNVDVLISSANKCIQGVPGFGFVILKKEIISHCNGIARSLSLDLFDQWKTMEDKNGKWRFTSPTHVVRAFLKAVDELEAEGGILFRYERYLINQRILAEGMRELGIKSFLPEELQSPVITSFLYPDTPHFSFLSFYQYLKDNGFVIYPGKISKTATFRIGSIGEVYPADMDRLLETVKDYLHGQ